MRKLFYLLGFLTIFNGIAGAQGGSSCVNLNIYCWDEQKFLDTVEAKLLHTIDKQNTKLRCWDVNPYDGTEWSISLTNNEIENNKLPAKYLPTNMYQLVINWDSTNTNGYLLGFSKEYYSYNVTYGLRVAPFYHIPIAQYKAFLDKRELNRLYKIIKKNFINYIDVDTSIQIMYAASDTNFLCRFYSDTSSLSYMNHNLKQTEQLVFMPLALWVNEIKDWMKQGEIKAYKDPMCIHNRIDYAEVNNIFQDQDTVVDENGSKRTIVVDREIKTIRVAEKWTLDTINNSEKGFYPYSIKFNREIKSIGIFAHNSDTYDILNIEKTAWVSYKDINQLSRKIGLRYYKEELDNALFKKLNLKFRW